MAKSASDPRTGGIQSLARASVILEEIVKHRHGISLARLAEAVGLHSSTTFHLVKTLVSLGYVRQDEETKHYRVGRQVFVLAASAVDDVELLSAGRPYLEELAKRTGETSHLAIKSGNEIVIIGRSDSSGAFRMAEHTGVVRPAHATALGKVLLAAATTANLDLFLEMHALHRLTPRTITDPERLRAELDKIRETDIAYDEGEFHHEIRCVATAVRDFASSTVAAIGISTPVWRLSVGELQEKTEILKSIALRLSRDLGFPEAGAANGKPGTGLRVSGEPKAAGLAKSAATGG